MSESILLTGWIQILKIHQEGKVIESSFWYQNVVFKNERIDTILDSELPDVKILYIKKRNRIMKL